MTPELLVVVAALCYASSHLVAKPASNRVDSLTAVVISTAAGTVVLLTVCAITVDSWSVGVSDLLLFSVAGLTGAGIGRLLMIIGVRDLGTSVSVPVQTSTNPLLSSSYGILLLGEPLSLRRLMALGLIICGVWTTAGAGSANVGAPHPTRTRAVFPLLGVAVPLLAGAAFAASDILRKTAVGSGIDPEVGALIGVASAAMCWSLIWGGRRIGPEGRDSSVRPTTSVVVRFSGHGILTAGAVTCTITALAMGGHLSSLSPILALQPLMVLVMGSFVLRGVEVITRRVVLGSLCGVAGVALLVSAAGA